MKKSEPDFSLNISILEGAFCTIHIAITTSVLVTGYALMLKANEFHLGLLSAFSALGTIGSIVGAELTGMLQKRKKLTILANLTGRGIWLVLCFLPFLPIIPARKLLIFLVIVFFSNFLVQLATNSWLSWMTDLVPEEKRGRYFSVRNTILGIVSMFITFGAGYAFDLLKVAYGEDYGFCVLFGLAVLAVIISNLIMKRQWEPPMRGERLLPLKTLLAVPFRDGRLRRFLLFALFWNFVIGIAMPFWGPYMIKNLEMSYATISLYAIISGSMALLIQPLWGKIIDRFGGKPLLIMCLIGITFLPVFWLFSTRTNYSPIWMDALITGVLWPGFNLAAFTMLLDVLPAQNKSACFAVNTVIAGVALFLGAFISGWVAEHIKNVFFVVGPITIVSFHLLFLSSALGRLLLLPLALRLEARSNLTALNLVHYLVINTFKIKKGY